MGAEQGRFFENVDGQRFVVRAFLDHFFSGMRKTAMARVVEQRSQSDQLTRLCKRTVLQLFHPAEDLLHQPALRSGERVEDASGYFHHAERMLETGVSRPR